MVTLPQLLETDASALPPEQLHEVFNLIVILAEIWSNAEEDVICRDYPCQILILFRLTASSQTQ
jgi:hypothetical protein